MVRVAKIRFVEIYAGNDDVYVVYNTKKPFKDGHTHIRNFNTANYLAKLVAYNQYPKSCKSAYLLESLIRLETDRKKIQKLHQMSATLKKKRRS